MLFDMLNTNNKAAAAVAPRQSNMELLRILVMFFILIQHANFLAIGTPSMSDCGRAPWEAFGRFFVESLSIVAVNVFVLISGWFGIKPRIEKLCSLIFQVLFFSLGVNLALSLLMGKTITVDALLKSVLITKCYWFIKSYICLFILSPVLNAFVETASKKQFIWLLAAFLLFQTIYGWTDSAPEFAYGYSVVSFAGLYLLSRYLRLYPPHIMFDSKPRAIIIYVLSAGLVALAAFILVSKGLFKDHSLGISYSYINPFNILASIGLFAFFVQLKIRSRLINYAASSCLAVYLFHINPCIFPIFQGKISEIYSSADTWLKVPQIIVFLILVYVSAILIDQIRKMIWGLIDKKIFVPTNE